MSLLTFVQVDAILLASNHTISEDLPAGPDLIDRLERGNPSRHGVAVVHAAADWFRAGLSRPVPLRVVRSLYPNYLPADDAELVGRFDEALDWACQPTSGVRIITRRTDGVGLVVHDYVLDYLSATLPPRLPNSTWETIADELTATNEVDDLAQVGATAYLLYDAPAIGERITRRAAENGSFGQCPTSQICLLIEAIFRKRSTGM